MSEERRLCRDCLRKEPPEETELVLGVNIKQYRWDHKNNLCDNCHKIRAADYRAGGKAKFAEYLQTQHDETIEELTQQWNDPAYSKLRNIADRVYKVWDKYGRREPAKGIRWQWICEVIFPDLWFIDANGIVEDFLKDSGWPRSKQITARPYLLSFVVSRMDEWQLIYRDKAYNRWIHIVKAIYKNHAGEDKMVATPQWEDPTTKDMVENYFLLSREQERKWREERREVLKVRADILTEEEKRIVDRIAEEEKRQKEKQDPDREKGGERQ
jgi:hypothetical protein